MGIRFVCHLCSFALHVKDFQAGKRGKCPNCNGSFRIPDTDASYSSALADSSENPAVAKIRDAFSKVVKTKTSKLAKKSSGSISITLEPNATATSEVGMEPKVASDVSANMPSNAVSKPTGPTMAMPAVLANAVDAKWFVRPPSGGQFGPAPSQMLMNWIAESRVTADSFLWRDGLAHWQLAIELVPELFITEKPAMVPLPSDKIGQTNEVALNVSSTIRSGAVLKKQMRKRRQQVATVVLLATISLILLSILIFVLVFQVAKPLQSKNTHWLQTADFAFVATSCLCDSIPRFILEF